MKIKFAVAAACLVFAAPAEAEIVLMGFTNGCFGSGCTAVTTQAPSSEFLAGSGLTYNNSTFDVTTASGFAALGSAGSPTPAANVDNLGSFLLSGAPFGYTGSSFTLRVSFTSPPGTVPNSALLSADLIGNVVATDHGGVLIDFNNTPESFSFTGGSFLFSVNDVSLTPGAAPVALTGQIMSSTPNGVVPVPEAGTWAMMLLGFCGLGLLAYWRKNSAPRFA